MKEYQIRVVNLSHTTINIEGEPRHYFDHPQLGKCRAIVISPDENLPAIPTLSKGDKLKILMDCGDRLHKRYWAFYKVYDALPENDRKGRNALFAKMEAVNNASTRLIKKIKNLVCESK